MQYLSDPRQFSPLGGNKLNLNLNFTLAVPYVTGPTHVSQRRQNLKLTKHFKVDKWYLNNEAEDLDVVFFYFF